MNLTDPVTLKAELAKPGRSQSGLARYLGLDNSAVNRLVNGGRDLKVREVAKIEEYLARTAAHPEPHAVEADSEDAVLAERLKHLMDARGTNPFRLSTDAGLGADAVRDILRGKVRAPSYRTLAPLARALETTVAYLVGEEDDPAPEPVAPVGGLTIRFNRRVRLAFDAELSPAVAMQILALIEGDKP